MCRHGRCRGSPSHRPEGLSGRQSWRGRGLGFCSPAEVAVKHPGCWLSPPGGFTPPPARRWGAPHPRGCIPTPAGLQIPPLGFTRSCFKRAAEKPRGAGLWFARAPELPGTKLSIRRSPPLLSESLLVSGAGGCCGTASTMTGSSETPLVFHSQPHFLKMRFWSPHISPRCFEQPRVGACGGSRSLRLLCLVPVQMPGAWGCRPRRAARG